MSEWVAVNGDRTRYSIKEQVSGTLRECRHTNWGEDGYLFYPNFEVITSALHVLRRWFDGI